MYYYVSPIYHLITTYVLPMYYYVSPIYHLITTYVLPMYYYVSPIYHLSTTYVLPMYYYVSPMYHLSTTYVPHLVHLVQPIIWITKWWCNSTMSCYLGQFIARQWQWFESCKFHQLSSSSFVSFVFTFTREFAVVAYIS